MLHGVTREEGTRKACNITLGQICGWQEAERDARGVPSGEQQVVDGSKVDMMAGERNVANDIIPGLDCGEETNHTICGH